MRAYDTYAADYAERLDPTLAASAARLAELADARPGVRVLDVATGTGRAAQAVAARGASVVAIDRSPGMLQVARRLVPELDFRRCDAHALPFQDACFDAAICGLSLSHFAVRETALREILRVLRPGGQFVASAWGEGSRFPTGIIDELLDRYGAAPPSSVELDEETWLNRERGGSELRGAGFADVSVITESHAGEFAHADEAVRWSFGWPLTAARVDRLDPGRRERLRRESVDALADSDLSWRFTFNFFLASKAPPGSAPA
jgi:SAM-dependent methyltransferase